MNDEVCSRKVKLEREDSFSFVSVKFEILRRHSSKDLKEDTDVRV